MSDTRTHEYKWPFLPAMIMTFGPVIYMTADRPVLGLVWLLFSIVTMRKVPKT